MSDDLLEALAGPARPLGLLESARVLGGLRWVELTSFELLGRLATGAGEGGPLDAATAVWASGASLGHAWRAHELERLLPVSAGLPSAAECTVAPGRLVEAFVEALARHVAVPGEGLASFYDLLVRAYEVRAVHPLEAADRAVVRTLGRLVADLRAAALPALAEAVPGRGA